MSNDKLREFGTVLAREESLQISEQIGKLLLSCPDLQRLFTERTFLMIKQSPVIIEEDEGRISYSFKRKYHLSYNSPSVVKRVKFFIFDISLWLKELLRK